MTDANVLATTVVTKKLTADMELHSMAHKHPLMSTELYVAHADSIRKDGQMVAVTLYRGKIVDGRHRLRALKEAGIETILVKELPNNWTLARVEKLVLTSEIRRHQSPTQLAIKGYDYYKDNSAVTQSGSTIEVGCKLRALKRVIQLEKLGRIDLINRLRDGDEINVSTDSRFTTKTDSLAAVVAMAKRQHDLAEKEIDVYEESENKIPTAHTAEEDQVTIDLVKLATKGKSEETIKKVVAALYEELEDRK